jgi:hypothetical protein
MTDPRDTDTADLTGTVDDRLSRLAELESAAGELSSEWLLRQLKATLSAWAADDTELDVVSETRTDF